MENTVMDFITKLSARMARETAEEYVGNRESALLNISKIIEMVEKTTVSTIEEYKKAIELKGALSSLSCYVFNSNKDNAKEVWDTEAKLGNKIYRFARNYGKASKDVRPVVKYLLWRNSYTSEDAECQLHMARVLVANNLLWKDGDDTYLVSGLHLAIGDNTFTQGQRGWYRNYVKSCVIQAFLVRSRWDSILKDLEEKGEITVPRYDESVYRRVSIRDGKGAAKISFSRKDKNFIFSNYIRR